MVWGTTMAIFLLKDEALDGEALSNLLTEADGYAWLSNSLKSQPADGTAKASIDVSGDLGDNKGKLGDAAFSLSGSGSIAVDYVVKPKPDFLICDQPSLPSGQVPVVLNAKGEMSVGLKGSMPLAAGGFSGNLAGTADGSYESQLQFVFAMDGNLGALEAGQKCLTALPEPWNLSAIAKAPNLIGVALSNAKQLTAGLSLTLKRGLKIKSIEGSASLTASASYALAGTHKICVHRQADGTCKLIIERSDTETRRFSGGLDVTLDLQPLIKEAVTLLREGLGPRADLIEILQSDDLLKPGSKARTILSDAIKDAFDSKDAQALLMTVLGKADLEEASKALVGLVQDRLDLTPEALFEDEIKPAALRLAGEVLDRVPLPSAAKSLHAPLTELITDSLESLQKNLAESLSNLADQLVGPLGKIGEAIDATVTDVDNLASKLRPHVEEYGAILRKLAAASEDAALAKFEAKLRLSGVTVVGDNTEAEILLNPDKASAVDFYNRVFLGDLAPLVALIRDGKTASSDGGVVLEAGRLKRWVETIRKSSLGISFLGYAFKSTGDVKSEAEWVVDRSGNISVETIAGRAEAKQVWQANDETKIVSFVNAHQLAVVAEDDDTWDAAFTLTYEDPMMGPEEIGHLLGQFKSAGLVKKDGRQVLAEAYEGLRSQNPAALPGAKFEASLILPGSNLNALMEKGSDKPDWVFARRAFAKRLIAQSVSKIVEEELEREIIKPQVTRQLEVRTGHKEAHKLPNAIADLSTVWDGREHFLRQDVLGKAINKRLDAHAQGALMALVTQVRGLGQALAAMHHCWEINPNPPQWQDRDDQKARLKSLQRRIGEGLMHSMMAGDTKTIIGVGDVFSPATLALLFTIAELAKVPLPSSFEAELSTLKKQ